MKCDQCGKENDNIAKFCKKCGNILDHRYVYNQENESYEVVSSEQNSSEEAITCPNCGSTNIHFITKQEGSDYDGVNACCGFLIFGPLGLLCGLISDKSTYTIRKCMRCQHEF